MKTVKLGVRFSILFLTFAVISSANAMLGDHKTDMDKQYGKSIEITADGFSVYQNGMIEIHAHFTDGVCDNMVYIANEAKPFDENFISTILSVESSGTPWVLENDNPRSLMWSTVDKRFHAVKMGTKISIFTDKFLKKRMKETQE